MGSFPSRLLLLWQTRLFLTTVPVALFDGFFFYANRPLFTLLTAVWCAVLLFGYAVYLPGLYRHTQYQVTDSHIRHNTGFAIFRQNVVPVANIQYLFISRTPLQRIMGLSTLHVVAAGGAVHLSGLNRGDAEALLHQITLQMEEALR